MSDLFRISDVSVQYELEAGNVLALDKVFLNIPSSKYTLGIVGESGSGKTTLGLSIMNVIEPPGRITGGDIEYEGNSILRMNEEELRRYRWGEVSMVYQSAMNSLNPVKKISDHIVEVIRAHEQIAKKEARERALKLLNEVGISMDRADDYSHELSGGMRQRVVIAMALALSPKLLIADEPTSALDVVVQRQILNLLRAEINQKNLSLLFITHEISLLSGIVDNIAVMYSGEIVETGGINQVLDEPLHPYTEMLASTLLTFESSLTALRSTTKSKETSEKLVANACKYANRCKYVFDRCRHERPLLKEAQKGRWVACHKYN